MDTPGVEARPFPSLVDRDHPDFNAVFFTDVVVPRENLLGELNDGWRIANGSLAHERGMLWVWESARLDQTLEMARTRARDNGMGADEQYRQAYASSYVDALALKCLGYRGFAKFAARAGRARAPAAEAVRVGSQPELLPRDDRSARRRRAGHERRRAHRPLRRRLAVRYALHRLVRHDHLRGYVRDPAQHRRRARPRPPPALARARYVDARRHDRPGRACPRRARLRPATLRDRLEGPPTPHREVVAGLSYQFARSQSAVAVSLSAVAKFARYGTSSTPSMPICFPVGKVGASRW